MTSPPRVIVIGAGIGGLATALRLADAGLHVTVLERHGWAGGKIRTVASSVGPVDAGPTVLTMRPVFEALFADVGETLDDHLTLHPLPLLARHYWRDGSMLDLDRNPEISAGNVAAAFGQRTAADYRAFAKRAARLFQAFDAPMMQSAAPTQAALTAEVMRNPSLIGAMAPHQTLAAMLQRQFGDKRLAQLFGRYATYVGGSPYAAPAILALVAHAEASGVWRVEGGMAALPQALLKLAQARGAVFQYDIDVTGIAKRDGCFTVTTSQGPMAAEAVVFNGDPRALRTGLMGPDVSRAVPEDATEPRSLSACVLSFAARASGPPLAHHTVFFADNARAEFDAVAAGRLPEDATLYICAQDRHLDHPPDRAERFEIILNAPPGLSLSQQEKQTCLMRIIQRLGQFGLNFDQVPDPSALTTPADFDQMFPASLGSLYGRSPHGLMAAFHRPTARSLVPGLYLTGGGAHPGAGVPMATLSARHAAAAIMADLPSTSGSMQTDTRGGMSTGSATTGKKRFLSSAS